MKEAMMPRAAVTSTDNRKDNGVQDMKGHSSSSNISDGKIACYSADSNR